jgi:tetratricopeptide (TPR) repeat protein
MSGNLTPNYGGRLCRILHHGMPSGGRVPMWDTRPRGRGAHGLARRNAQLRSGAPNEATCRSACWVIAEDYDRCAASLDRAADLLGEVDPEPHRGDGLLRARELLALSYHAAASVLTKLGEADLAWMAAERGLGAAQESENHVIVGSLFRSVAFALLATGRFRPAMQLVEAGATFLQPHLADDRPDLQSVYGTLFLAGSMAASRSQDRATTCAYLQEAHGAADRLAVDGNHLWTAFGPTNVTIHRVNTAMELGDVQVALDLAPGLDTTRMPIERRVRHLLDLSRAYNIAGRRDAALATVLDAERLAPEQIRHHYLSKQLVLSWVRNVQGKPGIELVGLARRMRIVA